MIKNLSINEEDPNIKKEYDQIAYDQMDYIITLINSNKDVILTFKIREIDEKPIDEKYTFQEQPDEEIPTVDLDCFILHDGIYEVMFQSGGKLTFIEGNWFEGISKYGEM